MDKSCFTEKNVRPTDAELATRLAGAYVFWQEILSYVKRKMPAATEEWNFPGEKYGWSFRLRDKKRAIIYLLPREKYFKVSMVFGQKAIDQLMNSSVSQNIKDELAAAKVYAEGRGIRLDVTGQNRIDIKTMIDIKMAN